ncbi:Carboxylic ester hydrolase [Pleurostoma richardsiae]|uniref:Carboxylic ester hydrolase n=1 Tax=Pleurostoma richardsiae TaxID=41990 RepID=A0AA38RAR3_9PEZI|nr:Carboxylic ester hydrolase [Pleurostoma richardsiae]
MEYSSAGTVDATKHGPSPVVSPAALSMETKFIQQELTTVTAPPASDTEGLNLNITVPCSNGQLPTTPLPVMVYIHGGGFSFGSNWFPHYDQARIVALSVELGCPIIAVNINYRLGIPGFLSSKELQDAGYPANRGIEDQKTAFRWIKRYITGFGGDASTISAIGQSAGAASVALHLHGTEQLFEKAILLGGTTLLMKPATPEECDMVYSRVMRDFGLDKLSEDDRIRTLSSIDLQELIQNTSPFTGLGPVMGGSIAAQLSFDSMVNKSDDLLPGKKWCPELMMVHCRMDASIMTAFNLMSRIDGLSNRFHSTIQNAVGRNTEASRAITRLLATYGIHLGLSDHEALIPITRFLTDIAFHEPAVTFAACWPTAYFGQFDEGNPWEGPFLGQANHTLDIAYLWQNYNPVLDEAQTAVATAFGEDIVRFVAGAGSNLPSFQDGEVLHYGPSSEGAIRRKSAANRSELAAAAQQIGGLDAVFGAAMKFLYLP